MGLRITNTIHTDKGDTNTLYLNINTINLNKNGRHNITINRYIDETVRLSAATQTCETFQVAKNFSFNIPISGLTSSATSGSTNNIYSILYGAITSKLSSNGLTVVEVI